MSQTWPLIGLIRGHCTGGEIVNECVAINLMWWSQGVMLQWQFIVSWYHNIRGGACDSDYVMKENIPCVLKDGDSLQRIEFCKYRVSCKEEYKRATVWLNYADLHKT